jgi:hypothetical protein
MGTYAPFLKHPFVKFVTGIARSSASAMPAVVGLPLNRRLARRSATFFLWSVAPFTGRRFCFPSFPGCFKGM